MSTKKSDGQYLPKVQAKGDNGGKNKRTCLTWHISEYYCTIKDNFKSFCDMEKFLDCNIVGENQGSKGNLLIQHNLNHHKKVCAQNKVLETFQ